MPDDPIIRHALPRVAIPISEPHSVPQGTAPPKKHHRYPTRHVITQDEADDDESMNFAFTVTTPSETPIFERANAILDNTVRPPELYHEWANAIIDPDTGAAMEYRHLIKDPTHRDIWVRSFANELGRLAQGVGGRETGTNTTFFIRHDQIPPDRCKDVTYGRICVDYRPQKKEPERTRLTVGGNLIDFPGDVSTPTADTTTAKLVINSTISTKGAKYMCGDIKNFYLGTPMK